MSRKQFRPCQITGFGTALPQKTVVFGDQTRYRVSGGENQLGLAVAACRQALERAGLDITDIDCLVSASAVGIQPIPCTAALIHEQLARGTNIPALDINTTCTSFITALDLMSYLVAAGRYRHVLIVSSEVGSLGLNENQRESYELFSDGAAAIVLSTSESGSGVVASMQRTWSEGAHSTEIRGGLTGMLPEHYSAANRADYLFDMDGRASLRIIAIKAPVMFGDFWEQSGLTPGDIDLVIPHQASRALGMIMGRIDIPEDKYIDWVSQYGNMVSASVPFVLCRLLEQHKLVPGSSVLLCGTAAGLTTNILALTL